MISKNNDMEKKEYKAPNAVVFYLKDAFLDGGAGASGTGGAEGEAKYHEIFDEMEYEDIF